MNEKMYTDINDKVKVIVESFGSHVRLTLAEGQNGTAHTMLKNLAWTCGYHAWRITDDMESFSTQFDDFAHAVKAFRAANVKQDRRGKGFWKQSPFVFKFVAQQRFLNRDFEANGYRAQTPVYKDLD